MLHLLPESASHSEPGSYAEAVARLASIRHALRLVDPYGGGPASDPNAELDVTAAWDAADEAKRRAFDARSAKMVSAAAAGLEALVAIRQHGQMPNAEASREMVDQIRRELAEVSRLILT
jgi:hypothetical protein